MEIVLVGAGRVGHAIAVRLAEEGHNITVVDNDEERVEYATSYSDVMAMSGNGSDYTVLINAGINKADLIIAVTSDDAVNMLCCLTAKKLGVKKAVARVRTMEYFRQMVFLKDELGLSLVFNPEKETASEISRILRFPSAAKVDSFAKGRAEMVEFTIAEGSPLANLPLHMLSKKLGAHRLLICAVEREGEVTIPKGDYILRADDIVHVVASPGQISSAFKVWGIFKRSVKNVIILGGSRSALYLGTELVAAGIRVKIIELDESHCKAIKEIIPKADVIYGDGTNPQLLLEEGLDTADAFVTLTGNDQDNIITSMFASRRGVGTVITKLNDEQFRGMVDLHEIGSVVSPKNAAAEAVSNYVRAIANSLAISDILALHKFSNGDAEALEFSIAHTADHVDVPLKLLKIRQDAMIGAIIRGDDCIIPGGEDKVMLGDTVIAVTTRSGIQKFDDLFED